MNKIKIAYENKTNNLKKKLRSTHKILFHFTL